MKIAQAKAHFFRPARVTLLSGTLSVLILAACSGTDGVQLPEEANTDSDRQTAFRIRSSVEKPLNEDSGWAAGMNESATVLADQPFRIRFEVEAADNTSAERFYQLQVRRNQRAWEPLGAENFPQPAKELEFDFSLELEQPLRTLWQVASGEAAAFSWQAEVGEAEGADEGHLQLQARDQAVLVLGRYQTSWEPVEFELHLRLPEQSASAGVVFGYEDAENYMRVDVHAGEALHVLRVTEGHESVLATHPFDVKRDHWAELKLIMEGASLTVEYDEEALVFTENLTQIIPPSVVGLYLPAGQHVDIKTLVVEGEPRSPRSSIMASASFEHGAQTGDLLQGSTAPFTGGAGISFVDTTPPWSAAGGHSEWEFPIVIRRFSDEAALNEAGDRFDYRLVNEHGVPLATDRLASVVLDVADGHLGGTFVETPMRIGPWEASNGDLYFLMEPAETWNALMTVKSSDGGISWREVDGAQRPKTGDLEGFASVLVDDHIHILHQTSDDVWYHTFRTSDHPEQPDTWAIQDERLASPIEPPTQVADLALRSDGSVVAVYGGPHKIHLRTRSPEGNWSEETVIDADLDPDLSGPTLVLGQDDKVHLAYTGNDGTAWYRQFLPDGVLSERVKVAEGLGTESEDIGSILPLVYLPESDTVSVIYRLAEGQLWERRVRADGNWSEARQVTDRAVIQNAVDADQAGADAIAFGDSIQLLFIEAETGQLYHTERRGEKDWAPAQRLIDDETVQWVRGTLLKRAGNSAVYGYVYDGGADGGSGMNRYRELPLQAQ